MDAWVVWLLKRVIVVVMIYVFLQRFNDETRFTELLERYNLLEKMRHYNIYRAAYMLQLMYYLERFYESPTLTYEIGRHERLLQPYSYVDDDGDLVIDPDTFTQKG